MSFVNLMANDVWSEADIVHRTEALLHSDFSKEKELILSRKLIGFSLGLVIPTADEQAELIVYDAAARAAQQAGVEARADMALLQHALDYERAQARLLLPEVDPDLTITAILDDAGEPIEIPDPAIAVDIAERAGCGLVLSAASQAVIDLVMLRNPPTIEEEPLL